MCPYRSLLIVGFIGFTLSGQVGQDPDLGMKILSSIARVISKRIRGASTRLVDASAQYISGRTRQVLGADIAGNALDCMRQALGQFLIAFIKSGFNLFRYTLL